MALPVALLGNDLIGQARTGTGKTFAFCVPILQRIVTPDDREYNETTDPGKPQALVVAPTRELAIQVTADLQIASSVRRARILTVYGGRAYEPQINKLAEGIDIVVGTPGRLLDLADQGYLELGQIKVLVLDEADEMLDLGFLPDVEKLIALTPELRQTMLFSATMPAEVVSLARRYLRHPLNIRAESPDETQTVPATAQFVYRAHPLDKEEIIARLLQAENRGLAMIFCKTKRQTQKVADELAARGFAAAAVHGDLGQGAREQALRAFRSGKVDVLVATDVAARGIDVEGVTHVINIACPDDEKMYLHRIGRTGRAGASGVAVTLVDWEDLARWRMINDALGLPFPEPVETYSSSEHFFHDLGVPPGTIGTLPQKMRTRAGLDAEAVEDLGETGRRRGPRSHGSRSRPRSSGNDGRKPRTGTSGADEERRPRRQRSRRRTRSGKPVEGASGAGADVAREPRDDQPAAANGSAANSSAANGSAQPGNDTGRTAAEGGPARRRRRRRRRTGSAVAAEQSGQGVANQADN
ncbi:MAG TPA: DEAD/DEAH box helicase [Jiangellaceae bacterium]